MTATLLATSASEILAQDRSQARSMVISQYGVVAAEQPIGTRAGFPVTEIFSAHWARSVSTVRGDAEASRVFLPEGRAPRVGEMFRNPDLGVSLETLARGGKDAFYKGALAQRILATSGKHGG